MVEISPASRGVAHCLFWRQLFGFRRCESAGRRSGDGCSLGVASILVVIIFIIGRPAGGQVGGGTVPVCDEEAEAAATHRRGAVQSVRTHGQRCQRAGTGIIQNQRYFFETQKHSNTPVDEKKIFLYLLSVFV